MTCAVVEGRERERERERERLLVGPGMVITSSLPVLCLLDVGCTCLDLQKLNTLLSRRPSTCA